MVLSCRVRPERLKCLSNHIKRWYFHTHRIASSGYISADRGPGFLESSSVSTCRRPTSNYISIRSFAAPVQAKPKVEAKDSQGVRMNNAITAPKVRLVSDEGHTVVSRREALERAKSLKLDLVEVQRHADPPVCKIMDFHKEMYKQQLKEKDRLKTKSEATLRKDIKEVRFTGKIEQKDLQMKADMVKRLMERGYRVKCMAMGKEEEDLGTLLSRLSVLIEDVAYVESGPRVERRQAFAVVRHIKYGAPKKNPGKKASGTVGSTKTALKSTNTSTATVSNISVKDGAGSNMDDEDLSDLEVVQEVQKEDGDEDRVMVHSSNTSTSLGVGKSEDPEKLFTEPKTWSGFASDTSCDAFDFDDNEKTMPTNKVDLSLSEDTGVAKLWKQKPPVSEGNVEANNRVASYRSVTNAQQHQEDRKPAFKSVSHGSKPTISFERLHIPVETKLGSGSVSSSPGIFKPPPLAAETKLGSDSVSSSPGIFKPPPLAAETKLGSDFVSSSSRNLKPPPQVAERKLGAGSVSSPPRSLKPPPQVAERKLGAGSVSSPPRSLNPPPEVAERKLGAGSVSSPPRILNPQPQVAERKLGVGSVSSPPRSLKPSPQEEAKKNVDSKQVQPPPSSYGIFSNPKTTTGDPRAPREVDTGRQQNPINLTNPSLGRPASKKNLPKPDTDSKQQEVDKNKQGGWGIFSIPSQPKNSDSPTKAQR
ncbi:hypothetical protein H6P81_018734 [Aristolochia fimbriata]|uniref:Translation initiation factor 3 N-terminal domain-containing protein n=1 Tax=Aristolochia fimbriata TaxID=158543 RepID=A0AAV7E1W2_ARIFI|nr:hypothetical protein H6P81_018734 [Aristolochia fimbriata]